MGCMYTNSRPVCRCVCVVVCIVYVCIYRPICVLYQRRRNVTKWGGGTSDGPNT